MRVGLIGIGRMGRVLAARLAVVHELYLHDRNPELAQAVAERTGAQVVDSLAEVAAQDIVILAVPDREVLSCIKAFNQLQQPVNVVNIATNVAQHTLEELAGSRVTCIGAKFVGQAGEMMLGLEPVIIVNDRPAVLTMVVQDLLRNVGQVVVGRADVVTEINTAAAKAALEAAVRLEAELRRQGINNPAVIKSAIRQVAAGILKAYADDDLGPFARDIVQAVKARLKNSRDNK